MVCLCETLPTISSRLWQTPLAERSSSVVTRFLSCHFQSFHCSAGAPGRCQQGHWIAFSTGIPEHDLDYLLELLEREKYLDRDPGPFDQPYTSDRMGSWWGPGRNWLELKALYRSEW